MTTFSRLDSTVTGAILSQAQRVFNLYRSFFAATTAYFKGRCEHLERRGKDRACDSTRSLLILIIWQFFRTVFLARKIEN